jgi:hypothetical protein
VCASVADGAEFESERVFEDGELTEAERPEWMEKVHQVTAPISKYGGDDGGDDNDGSGGTDDDNPRFFVTIVSEAEKQRTEQEFRKQKATIVPQRKFCF